MSTVFTYSCNHKCLVFNGFLKIKSFILFYILLLFTVPVVDFLVKIQEVKAIERQDAVFECVLSSPLSKISWMGKSTPLVQGEKYDISVSEDMLIHRLLVKDCVQVDKGIYAAVAGMKSCNAWLIVERKIKFTFIF